MKIRFLKHILLTLALLMPFVSKAERPTRTDSIASALMTTMETFPASTLLDIYKLSFQNLFGPGHLLNDTDRAKQYLDWELQQEFRHTNPDYEPTFYDGRFVRVNLALIKEGRLDYDTFFDAFVQSARSTQMPSIQAWIPLWEEILEVVYRKYPNLPDIDRDSEAIHQRLQAGQYQGEHSEAYVQAYDPHYRIIRKEIFESRLKPLIEASSAKSAE